MKQDIILITGGAGNIAKQMVKTYLNNGAKVIAVDILKETSSVEFIQNKDYEYYQADVTNIHDLEELYQNINKKYGRITHIISAAGRPINTEISGIDNVTFEDINQSILLNLNSHIYVTKIFLPLLEMEDNSNKSIIFVSSINALKAFNLPIYSAAKSGIYGFMHALTKELGKGDIRINTISPGTVPTPEDLASNGDFYNYRYKDMIALKDFTKPEDIADVAYSLTHITKAITGQNIVVDSGQML